MDQQSGGSDDAELLLLPVGQDTGAATALDAGTGPARVVRRGTRQHDLDERESMVWTLAHGSVAAVRSDTPWRRTAVADIARVAGLVDPEPAIDSLVDRGLLAEVLPGTDTAINFARTHRLVPLMLGLGNSAREPDRYAIGHFGSPVVHVDFPTYDLWQWSAVEDSIWSTCEGAADQADRDGAQHLDAEKILVGFLRSVHSLLVGRACYLDISFRLDHPQAG